jgi:hypothetical protein
MLVLLGNAGKTFEYKTEWEKLHFGIIRLLQIGKNKGSFPERYRIPA